VTRIVPRGLDAQPVARRALTYRPPDRWGRRWPRRLDAHLEEDQGGQLVPRGASTLLLPRRHRLRPVLPDEVRSIDVEGVGGVVVMVDDSPLSRAAPVRASAERAQRYGRARAVAEAVIGGSAISRAAIRPPTTSAKNLTTRVTSSSDVSARAVVIGTLWDGGQRAGWDDRPDNISRSPISAGYGIEE